MAGLSTRTTMAWLALALPGCGPDPISVATDEVGASESSSSSTDDSTSSTDDSTSTTSTDDSTSTSDTDDSTSTSTSGTDDSTSTSDTDTSPGCTEPIINGDVIIASAAEIPDYDCVVEITGALQLHQVDGIELDGFPLLERVGGTLFIGSSPSLVKIVGFPALRQVGSLSIHFNPVLEQVEGFGMLELVELSLRVVGNDLLVDLSGFTGPLNVGSYLQVGSNASLTSLGGLAGVTDIGGDFIILENPALVEIVAPEIPMMVGGEVQICGNPALTQLPMPADAVVGGVTVIRNLSLANATGVAFATALGHPEAKVAGNQDLGDYPIDPCPWLDDGTCDGPAMSIGGRDYSTCDPGTGDNCCGPGGPNGLCVEDSDDDCPPGFVPW